MRKMRIATAGFATAILVATGVGLPAVASEGNPPEDELSTIDAQTLDEKYGIGPVGRPADTEVGKLGISATEHDGENAITPAPMAVDFSPAGCVGQTDDPHPSPGHINPTDASVHGHTDCDFVVSHVDVSTVLKRQRWYGQQTLESDYANRWNSNYSDHATPHWNCEGTGIYSYYGYSVHTSLENGTTYSISTEGHNPDRSRFSC